MLEDNKIVVVRGGGDLATGAIHKLWAAGFPVLVLETAAPAAIRRQVCVCEAVYNGTATVEGMTAVHISELSQAETAWAKNQVPVLVDPECNCLQNWKPMALVDGILAKKNLGTHRGMADWTIALGPGFVAGQDVDAVIETSRGHDLGRVYFDRAAKANTGIPGIIGGYGKERVIHAPTAGILRNLRAIGDIVEAGEPIAFIDGEFERVPVPATITGILRGLLREGYPVPAGFKIADIDPRKDELQNCFTISDKSRCIAGSVLEQVCAAMHKASK